MYKLRKYQEESVKAGVEFLKDNKNKKRGGILIEPTASGKSLVIINIARKIDGNVLILQPSKEILEQNLQKARDYGFTNVGVFSASCRRKDIGKITFATIGSVINKKELFSDTKHIIIDECHAVNAKNGMYKELIEYLGVNVIGLTATAFRLHSYEDMRSGERVVVAKFLHRTRPRLFHEILHVTQIKEMYENKFLCPVEYILNDSYDQEKIKLNTTGRDFDIDDLKKYNEEKDIVGLIKEIIKGLDVNHILIFCVFINEANRLARELSNCGISSAMVSSETNKKEREIILDEFKNGRIKVVTNVGVLTTGFDFPALDCLVLARPTQSVALYYQMIGRGLRISDTKETLKVIDICGNVDRFGRIETFEIIEKKKGMHRLKSDKSFLTGYDFIRNNDLEINQYQGFKETTGENISKIIPFGKYKGQHITKLPTDYLEWCIKNFTWKEWVIKFEREIERRKLNNREKKLSTNTLF